MAQEIKRRLEEVESLLDEYDKKLFLNKITIKEIDIETSISNINHMPIEDIHQISLEWGYYALGLQKEINKHKTRKVWTDSNLHKYVIKQSKEQSGYTYEERKDNVINGDEYASSLYDLQTKVTMAIERLSFLVNKIDFLIKIALDIVETKRRNQYATRN